MEAIQVELINLLMLVLTTLAGYVAKQATSYLKKRGALAELENNKVLVNIVVNAVEQMYTQLDGANKFEMVKQDVVNLLQEKKIKISDVELNHLIESSVKEMKKGINEGSK